MPDPNIEATVQAVIGQLRRAGVTSGTGLTGYDLQAGAKLLVPVVTPLRNLLPRVKGAGGLATNFKAITQINSANLTPGVGEGHRNAANTTAIATRSIPYATIGQDDLVTFEAIDAAVGWENLPSTVKQSLLWSLMLNEEQTLLWGAGNAIGTQSGSITAALGKAVLASVAATTGTGLVASTSYTVYGMALTYEGLKLAGGYTNAATVANQIPVPGSRSNMGGTTDNIPGGAGQISASGSATTGASGTLAIAASITPIAAAAGYAWFIGTSAGTARLAAITALPTFTFTSAPSTTQLASVFTALAADNSVNPLEFTGLIPYIAGSPLAYTQDCGGVALSSDGGRGVSQLNTAYLWFWNNYRTSPSKIWVSANKANQIDQLISKNANGQNNFLTVVDATKGADVSFTPAGRARVLVNPMTNTNVDLVVHPLLNDSTIVMTSDKVPFPANGITNPMEYHYQRDYFGQDWPVNNRQYEYGVYTRGALAVNAEMLFGLLYNVA